jgi:hypothetical protein
LSASHRADLRRTLGAGLAALFALVPLGAFLGPASATGTFSVIIASSDNPADAGFPFELTSKVFSDEAPQFYNWTDSLGGTSSAPTWELDIGVPGNLTVRLDVTTPSGNFGADTLTVLIRPPPSVTVSSPLTAVDAGVPAPILLGITGGVPPLTASWAPYDAASNESGEWPTDGSYLGEVNFSTPGPGWVLARVVDALGDSASADDLVTEVVPQGTIALSTNGSVGEVGWPLGIAVAIQQGAPPFQCLLSSSLPFSNSTGPFRVVPSDGTYRWSVSFAFSGVAMLNLTAVDTMGARLSGSTSFLVEPPLSVHLTAPELQTTSSLLVSANVSGGLAPYTYALRLSDGETSNGTIPSAGAVSVAFDPPGEGNYTVGVRVTDALGVSSNSTEFLRVLGPSPSTADPPSSTTPAYLGVAVLAVILVLVVLYAYRRFGRPSPAAPTTSESALPTVRDLMKQSQVIDRETLLLLSEEAGLATDAVQSAIRALLRTGEVTSEPGPTHDDVLRWMGDAPPGAPEEVP